MFAVSLSARGLASRQLLTGVRALVGLRPSSCNGQTNSCCERLRPITHTISSRSPWCSSSCHGAVPAANAHDTVWERPRLYGCLPRGTAHADSGPFFGRRLTESKLELEQVESCKHFPAEFTGIDSRLRRLAVVSGQLGHRRSGWAAHSALRPWQVFW